MTLAVVNRIPASRVSLVRHRTGRAVLTATLVAPFENTGLNLEAEVTLELAGTTAFKGKIWRVGRDAGLTALVARDAVGLERVLPPKYYKATTFALVATDILRETRETGVVNLPGGFERYSRLEAPGHAALRALTLEGTGDGWRTRLDGSLVVGKEEPTEANLEWGDDLLSSDPTRSRFEALLRPDLEPNTVVTLDPYGEPRRGRLERVEHRVDGGKARTLLWL